MYMVYAAHRNYQHTLNASVYMKKISKPILQVKKKNKYW